MWKNFFTGKNIIILIILMITIAMIIYLIVKDCKYENFVSYDKKNKDYKTCSRVGGYCIPEYNGNMLSILNVSDKDSPFGSDLLNKCFNAFDANCEVKPLINQEIFQNYIVEQLNKNKSKKNFKNKLIWIQFLYNFYNRNENYTETREAWNLYHINSKGLIYDLTNDGSYFSIRFPYIVEKVKVKNYYENKNTNKIGNIANDGYFKP